MSSCFNTGRPLPASYDVTSLGYVGMGAILPFFVSVTVKDRDFRTVIGVLAVATLTLLVLDLAELDMRARGSVRESSHYESETSIMLPICFVIASILERTQGYFYPHLKKKKKGRNPKKAPDL